MVKRFLGKNITQDKTCMKIIGDGNSCNKLNNVVVT